MEDVIHGMSREFDADIGLQIIDSTPGAGAVSPVAIAGDAGAAAGVQLFSNLKAPALGAGGQPLQARRELELGGRRWTLQMAPQPGFVQRFQDDGHHPVALLGTVLSLILAWFTWLLATGRERAVALARDMTAELRATRDDLESTLSAIPDLLFELGLDGCIHHYRSGPIRRAGGAARDVSGPPAARCGAARGRCWLPCSVASGAPHRVFVAPPVPAGDGRCDPLV